MDWLLLVGWRYLDTLSNIFQACLIMFSQCWSLSGSTVSKCAYMLVCLTKMMKSFLESSPPLVSAMEVMVSRSSSVTSML